MTPQPHLVTRDRHGAKKWLRHTGYTFAGPINVAPIAAAELSHAARALPLAFVLQDDKPVLVALMGLLPGQNLFVAPDGRWLGLYVPAALRGYPFRLGRTDGEGNNFALLVDEASELVIDQAIGEEGIAFFDEAGNPHPETQKVLEFLAKTRQSMEMAERAVAALADKGVLETWPLQIKDGDNERQVAGVSRINEAALNALSPAIAYAQLLSIGNLAVLSTLAQAHAKVHAQKAARMTIPAGSFVPEDDGELKIDWNALFKDDEPKQ
jgi:hypothetical protein